ncbi:MerR family transcriptional regulator [Promicromonospora thailandica]|uniref:DNA-binding transcriptional regulator, MerR family n=1 Tax=Promicromonospora thailandica TaxID=765201 RepID=A0A9X2G6N0_9MICO|nr:MerR family transcriptional regulator [Promicromonospora thailandica]MCP2266563.1 DNA-binding transcriptional regulator, MerR family [Promicromonospora thailandica]BFF17363.1 MerR family transcriptional regulator [Promicromonospora thailandica]
MAWSTRELADLAGTTVNTVRHYHRLGLLEEPERRYNGYKQYEVRHLVSLLRIRRLADLGVPLAQIGEVGAAASSTPEALREIDAELKVRIEHLEKARSDIAAILREQAPADGPAGFESLASRMSEADSSLVHIYTQLYDEAALADVRAMVEADTDAVSAEMDDLPPDADEATRIDLAERLAPAIAQNLLDYPWLSDPVSHLSKSEHVTRETFVDAVVELYNPAQLEVLARASAIANEQVRAIREAQGMSADHTPDQTEGTDR